MLVQNIEQELLPNAAVFLLPQRFDDSGYKRNVLTELLFKKLVPAVHACRSELSTDIRDGHVAVRDMREAQQRRGVNGGQEIVELQTQAFSQFRQVFPPSLVINDFKEAAD